jgi:anthranilate phosphoribosyltransferase
MTFDVRPYLKEIARGEHGARDLSREQARTLFAAVFSGEVPDLALGALLVALRVKGETAEELAGMMDALAPHVRPMQLPARRPAVFIPSYNGARKLANLVPLLGLLLAREGISVVVHGTAQEPTRVSTFEILAELGEPAVSTIAEAEERLERRDLAPVPVEVLSPDLGRLLAARLTIGVRNSGHTAAKLLLPRGVDAALACRLIAVTHPEFLKLMREYFTAAPANVFLMRGVEGEPIVRLHAPQPIEEIKAEGQLVTHLVGEGEAGYLLPSRDARSTAQWTRDVLEGKIAPPAALAREVALIVDHCRRVASAHRQPLKLVSSK